jgi:hypothetical protein
MPDSKPPPDEDDDDAGGGEPEAELGGGGLLELDESSRFETEEHPASATIPAIAAARTVETLRIPTPGLFPVVFFIAMRRWQTQGRRA